MTNKNKTLSSFRKIRDGLHVGETPGASGEDIRLDQDCELYLLKFYGDHGFNNYISAGGSTNDSIKKSKLLGSYWPTSSGGVMNQIWCSSFYAKNSQGQRLWAHNFDHVPASVVLMYHAPPNKRKSISLSTLGSVELAGSTLQKDYQYKITDAHKDALFAASYVPIWGVNDAGVGVTVQGAQEGYIDYTKGYESGDPNGNNRTKISEAAMNRYILDNATSAASAMALLGSQHPCSTNRGIYYMSPHVQPVHWWACDHINGHAYTAGFTDGDYGADWGHTGRYHYRNNTSALFPNEWFAMTNFLLDPGLSGPPVNGGQDRYNYMMSALASQSVPGVGTESQAMNLLLDANVCQNTTVWSVVINLDTFSLDLVISKQANQVYHFDNIFSFFEKMDLVPYGGMHKHEYSLLPANMLRKSGGLGGGSFSSHNMDRVRK